MDKYIQFNDYEMRISSKKINTEDLLEHYDPIKIEEFCKACPNYDKIWSCPPFDFSTYDFLNKYSKVIIYSGEISFNDSNGSDEDKISKRRLIFDLGRKEFRRFLTSIEEEQYESEALIAGHCFLCEECTRIEGKKCNYPKKLRYSLESMGIDVSSLLETVLNQGLSWDSEKLNPLVTVGAVLIK